VTASFVNDNLPHWSFYHQIYLLLEFFSAITTSTVTAISSLLPLIFFTWLGTAHCFTPWLFGIMPMQSQPMSSFGSFSCFNYLFNLTCNFAIVPTRTLEVLASVIIIQQLCLCACIVTLSSGAILASMLHLKWLPVELPGLIDLIKITESVFTCRYSHIMLTIV